jgi:hypothetical protein
MGRPLKIQKIISTANPGVDNGYPNFGSLTAPVKNSADTLNDNQFLGVVGGSNTVDTATFPTVKCRVFITGIAAEEDGYIIRQKGAHKYLVGGTTARSALIAGNAYRITVVGNTDWNSYGLVGTAAVGAIFTATSVLANTGTGRVNAVGVCTLANLTDTNLTEGSMNITYTLNDSTAVTVSKLTNKFVRDWTGFANAAGTSLSTYGGTGNNVGVVNYTGEGVVVANFFTDEGTVEKSGAQDATNGTAQSTGTFFNSAGAVTLGIVENYNS